jgi:hypothetical protein
MINFEDYERFKPSLTPDAVMHLGAFGGTYFRPIYSKITKKQYVDEYKKYNLFNNLQNSKLCCSKYDIQKNLFKVKCGTSLEYWESKNWIKEIDPYGWFQWYCNFYSGRRCYDDERQIKRWIRRYNLYLKRKKTSVIRQVWLHWAIL